MLTIFFFRIYDRQLLLYTAGQNLMATDHKNYNFELLDSPTYLSRASKLIINKRKEKILSIKIFLLT